MTVEVNSTSLVGEWSRAVQQVDLYRIQQLLDINIDLLWTPLVWDPDRDASHVIHQLMVVQNLGTTLDDLCALPYTLIQYFEPNPSEVPSAAQVQTEDLLYFLIDQSSVQDLNNRVWGNCKNTTLHLVSFLGHIQIAQRLLKEKNVSMDIANDIGCLPRDVAQTTTMARLLGATTANIKQLQQQKRQSIIKSKPNYATPDRFKQLKQLAESTNNPNKSHASTTRQEGRYFRAGHVAESKMKVLNDEEAKLEKQLSKRRQEVAQLAKRSAVKSNPLFQKFEQEQGISKPKRSFIVKNKKTTTNDTTPTTKQATTRNNDMERSTSLETNDTKESTSSSIIVEEPEEIVEDNIVTKPKRNSKVISSLRTNTYVSSSVFRQDDEDLSIAHGVKPSPSVSSNSMRRTNSDDNSRNINVQQENGVPNILQPVNNEEQSTSEEHEPTSPMQDRRSLVVDEINVAQKPETENVDRRRLSGSQKAHWSIALNSWSSVLDGTIEQAESVASSDTNDDDDDDVEWFDSQDQIEQVRKKKSKASLKSISSSKTQSTNSAVATTTINDPPPSTAYYLGSLPDLPSSGEDDNSGGLSENNYSTNNPTITTIGNELDSYSSYQPPSIPRQDDVNTTVRIISRSRTNTDASLSPSVMTDHSSSSNSSSSSSSSSPATMSPSSPSTLPLASIPEKNINSMFDDTNNTTNNNKNQFNYHSSNYGSVSVQSTSRYVRRLSHAQNAQQQQIDHKESGTPMLQYNSPLQQFKIKRVPVKLPPAPSSSSSFSSPLLLSHQEELLKQKKIESIKKLPSLQDLQASLPPTMTNNVQNNQHSHHGKLYFRVTGISNVLLPLPREPTYVRLVVSDDRYEYMSRYEMLGQHIKFDYECIMDTYPEMIITISLHVRPDYHVRNKLPLTRLFSTSRNRARQGSLSNYIYQDDGSLGRARFALPHMMESCYERPYATQFDCFNAWSGRDKAKHHHHEDDTLKVIGNLDVEMLYLPVSNPSAAVPRNLRDCDMAIKVQQWNETFWNTEQVSNTTIAASSVASGQTNHSTATPPPSSTSMLKS
ncbi:hypothetical protein INT45_008831 [Circinella minor]|uniref:C2 domain-containing protein n=1 Tax=Circinella minor TaxID=1195481 RepID=A0A8H7S4Q5_9FUNG|nr:hypothetical protein INT45_008831 [Circinella minor]